jgi:hypothetical protein
MITARMVRAAGCAVAAGAAAILLAAPAEAGTAAQRPATGVGASAAQARHLRPRPDLAGVRVRSPNSAP